MGSFAMGFIFCEGELTGIALRHVDIMIFVNNCPTFHMPWNFNIFTTIKSILFTSSPIKVGLANASRLMCIRSFFS